MDHAACRGIGPDPFFPRRGQSQRVGKEFCERCPVSASCSDYAERSESNYGIWGGRLRTRIKPQPEQEEVRMIPKSLSATSIQAYEECPARFRVEYVERAPSPSGAAASLGTSCHTAMEVWVADGHYQKDYPDPMSVMKGIYDEAYWAVFADSSRYDEGLGLVRKWLKRQDWSDREVLSTEAKLNFKLKTSAGLIPFNYIMDRMDLRRNGDIEVIDYKSLSMPVAPEQLKHKIQARCYALAAQLEHPDAERIWVTFDMLRFDPVGIVFSKEENRGTWKYLHAVAERIIADTEAPETLGEGCRYCIRKSVCASLAAHTAAGGPLGISDPIAAAEARYRIQSALGGLRRQLDELDAVLLAHCQADEITGFDAGPVSVAVSVTGRRGVDAERVAQVVGGDVMMKYGELKISTIDELLKSNDIDDEQKSAVRQLIFRNYSEPAIKVAANAAL